MGIRRSRLVQIVKCFVEGDSWSASRLFLERHPSLLSAQADEILADLVQVASAAGDTAAAAAFAEHRSVLCRYVEIGGAAFDELIAPQVPSALRERWVAAEAAYERFRARPSRVQADAAAAAMALVLRDWHFAAVPTEVQAGMHQAAGTVLGERYQRFGGSAADLEDARTFFAAALNELPPNAPDEASCLSGLSNVLGMRYELRGEPEDLDAMIDLSRRSVMTMPIEERWWLLQNLGASLAIRHDSFGDPADLDEAVEVTRTANGSDPPPDAAAVLAAQLGNLLLARYERDGGIDDLRAAIEVAGAPLGSSTPRVDRAAAMVTLATAQRSLAERLGTPETLDSAVLALMDAIALLPRRSPQLSVCWGALGDTLVVRFQLHGTDDAAADDLRRAYDAYSQALQRADPGALRAAQLRSSLGLVTLSLTELLPSDFDLGQAVDELRTAAGAALAYPRLAPILYANLGTGLREQYRRTGRPEHLRSGIAAYRLSCREGLRCDLESARNAALDWGDWAVERAAWAEACTAYGTAFEAVDRLDRRQLDRQDREIWLNSAIGLGSQAALAAANAVEPSEAAVFAERGRARLLDLAGFDLVRVNPDLAQRYAHAAAKTRSLDRTARTERSERPD